MDIKSLLAGFKAAAQSAYGHRNNPEKWSGWIETGKNATREKYELDGAFTAVSVELTGLLFEFAADGETIKVEGMPGVHKMSVAINGEVQEGASIVVASKPTISHPLRTAIDVKNVEMDGKVWRFNLRFNG